MTSASVACGAHAGSPAVMAATVEAAVAAGVVVGAHPSYPDRAGFGRRPLDMEPQALTESLGAQISALQALGRTTGAAVRFVKPHGALYHRAATDEGVARLLADAVHQASAAARRNGDMGAEQGLVLLLGAGAPTRRLFEDLGVAVVAEAFADRAYRPDGRLVARHHPGAVLSDAGAVVEQALSVVLDGRVRSADGTVVELQADSLCLHGDTPGATLLARRVRDALERAGVRVAPFVS